MLCLISRQRESSAELQAGQCADGIAEYNPTMIENFLEFRRGFGALVCGQVGFATQVDGIKRAEERMDTDTRRAQFIGNGSLHQFQSLTGVTMIQRQARAQHGQVAEFDRSVLREPTLQFIGAWDESPESAGAKATPYEASRSFDSFSAAAARFRPSEALPKKASRTAAPASHRPALFQLSRLLSLVARAARHDS